MQVIRGNQREIPILFEDDDILVFSKPSGIVVNNADTVQSETVQSLLHQYLSLQRDSSESVYSLNWRQLLPDVVSDEFGTPEEIFAERKGMVHRLDKDTSGVMVWAKNPGALLMLLKQFKERTVQKSYYALCHGKFALLSGTISLPIARSSYDRKKMTADPLGRAAETEYRVKQFYPYLKSANEIFGKNARKVTESYQGFSLVECLPKTGRTHQLRVHLSQIHHPIVSDPIYGGKKRIKRDELWCQRLFLHARTLTLDHPRTKERMQLQSPLPTDLEIVLTRLEENVYA